MLSSINDIRVSRVIQGPAGQEAVKVYDKNPEKKSKPVKEATPAAHRNPDEFVNLGGKGDQQLFDTEDGSRYIASPDHAKAGK